VVGEVVQVVEQEASLITKVPKWDPVVQEEELEQRVEMEDLEFVQPLVLHAALYMEERVEVEYYPELEGQELNLLRHIQIPHRLLELHKVVVLVVVVVPQDLIILPAPVVPVVPEAPLVVLELVLYQLHHQNNLEVEVVDGELLVELEEEAL
jgi:hypothetical protein